MLPGILGEKESELSEMELSAAEKGAVISANVTRCFENQSPAAHNPRGHVVLWPPRLFGPASLCLQEGKVISPVAQESPMFHFVFQGCRLINAVPGDGCPAQKSAYLLCCASPNLISYRNRY